jgi:hypothetical protein
MQFFTHHTLRHVHQGAASACSTLIVAAQKPLPGISLIICALLVLSTSGSTVASPEHSHDPAGYLDMPTEYGEAIFRINPHSSKQLYIIGISHRDPDSGANNSTTVRTQMEIFRIGEWLKENRRLDLLLPEGYFAAGKTISSSAASAIHASTQLPPVVLDNAYLQESLAANSPGVNAEKLLMRHYNLHASQVEDKKIYNAVRNSLGKLKTTGDESDESTGNIAELIYLQEVRTAQILQNIPGVIEYEFLRGAVGNRSALFTIGLNHIKDIFRYIENEEIYIEPPSGIQSDSLTSNLNLLQRGYGITIIIPRTLANDHKLLRMTDIDRILLADGEHSGRYPQN